jgi:hypothetical protein
LAGERPGRRGEGAALAPLQTYPFPPALQNMREKGPRPSTRRTPTCESRAGSPPVWRQFSVPALVRWELPWSAASPPFEPVLRGWSRSTMR